MSTSFATTIVRVLASAFSVLVAAPVVAQVPAADPYPRGLFGSQASPPSAHSVDLLAIITEGYDDDVLADARPIDPVANQVSGYFTRLLTNVDYSWRGKRA